jgi:signal transduction histidine kinase
MLVVFNAQANTADSLLVPDGSIDDIKLAGDSAYYSSNYVKALACYDEVLKRYQNKGDDENVNRTLIFIAEIHRGARSFNLGLRKLEEVELRIKNSPKTEMHAYLHNRRAAIFFELQEHQKAIDEARKSYYIENNIISQAKRNGNNFNIIGAAHRVMNNSDSALYYSRRSIMVAKAQNDPHEILTNTFNLGEFYFEVSAYDSALYYLNKASLMSRKLKRRSLLFNIYTSISHIYEEMQEYEKALYFSRRQVRLHDSILNDQSNANFNKISASSERIFNKKEKQLAIQQRKTQNLIQTSAFIVILLLLVIVVLVIISKRKSTQLNALLIEKTKDLDKRNNELQSLNEVKNKLFSLLAHDLRAPVASLSGILGILEEDGLDSETRKDVIKKLRTQFYNTENLLGSIVTWSKSQIQGGVLNIETVNIDTLIQSEVDLMAQNAKSKSIDIIVKNQNVLPVKTDADIVGVIVRNILGNALKFTPKGGKVEVGCNCQDQNRFSIWIKDNGVGMSTEKLNQLFSATTRTSLGTNNEKGFGLGLMLCYDFAQMLKAEIKVESQEGLGSTFTVVFPTL